jgi:hypothetical protein
MRIPVFYREWSHAKGLIEVNHRFWRIFHQISLKYSPIGMEINKTPTRISNVTRVT